MSKGLLQTIQFSIQKQFYFKQFSFAEVRSLNVKTVLFQAIQFSISTQFSSIWPIDRTLIRCYHPRPEWTWEQWQWKGTRHSPKLQHYWNLTIRLFSVISGHSYFSIEKQSIYSTVPADWASTCKRIFLVAYLEMLTEAEKIKLIGAGEVKAIRSVCNTEAKEIALKSDTYKQYVLYTHNLHNSMNERNTHTLFIKIYLSFYSHKGPTVSW